MTLSKVLIIIPTYNERENIVLIIPEIKNVLPQCHILVVDDSSPDGTADCVKALSKDDPTIQLLQRAKKEGLGKAYISGFKWALQRDYELVFEMDADFSHNPRYLPDFITAAKDNDLIIGSRYVSGVNVVNWPMTRLLLSYFANLFARILTGIPVKDCTGGYKCFRRNILESMNFDRIASSGYSFQIELNFFAWKKGFRLKEIPIIFTDRQRGASKMSTKIVREALFLTWKLRLSFLFRKP